MKRISTTVKLEETLYDNFKILCINNKVSLQRIVEKCIHKYVNDIDFRDDINQYNEIPFSFHTSSSISN